MNKKKGNLTLKQLEDKKRIAILIGIAISVILGLISIQIIAILKIQEINNVVFGLIIFTMLPIVISQLLTEEFDKQIELKEKEIKAKLIKKIAKEGKLKESVVLKKEEIINELLFKEIEKVVIQTRHYQGNSIIWKDSDYTLSIYLKNGDCISGIKFSDKKLFDLIGEEVKENILHRIISDIYISTQKDENSALTFIGDTILYEQMNINDEELLEMFDLKE